MYDAWFICLVFYNICIVMLFLIQFYIFNTINNFMVNKNNEEHNQTIWDGLSKLANILGPQGVPFTLIFMANVLLIFSMLLLVDNFPYLSFIISGAAFFQLALGSYIYHKKTSNLQS